MEKDGMRQAAAHLLQGAPGILLPGKNCIAHADRTSDLPLK
jgi:hypothetical protein